MSTETASDKAAAKTNEQVGEVAEKLEQLNVDSTHEANDERPQRRSNRFSGRGRGRGGRFGGGRKFPPRIPYEEQLKKIEEDQKSKKVIETGVKGYVKWFSVRGRYGFVARENGEEKEDFFVHQTAIAKSSTIKVFTQYVYEFELVIQIYLRTLDDEEPVVFDIVEGRKGPEAANVTGPDGENVRGSRYSRQLLFRFRRPFNRRGPPRHRGENRENGAVETEKSENQGEERGQRHVRRARGKLNPDAPKNGPQTDRNGNDQEVSEEKGNGDGASVVKKRNTRRRNNKGKKPANTEQSEQQKEPATAQA